MTQDPQERLDAIDAGRREAAIHETCEGVRRLIADMTGTESPSHPNLQSALACVDRMESELVKWSKNLEA